MGAGRLDRRNFLYRQGGYLHPVAWANLVQRVQTGHNPDPTTRPRWPRASASATAPSATAGSASPWSRTASQDREQGQPQPLGEALRPDHPRRPPGAVPGRVGGRRLRQPQDLLLPDPPGCPQTDERDRAQFVGPPAGAAAASSPTGPASARATAWSGGQDQPPVRARVLALGRRPRFEGWPYR